VTLTASLKLLAWVSYVMLKNLKVVLRTKLGVKTTEFSVVKGMVDMIVNSLVKAMNTFFDIVL
jgi:hypothetical protein